MGVIGGGTIGGGTIGDPDGGKRYVGVTAALREVLTLAPGSFTAYEVDRTDLVLTLTLDSTSVNSPGVLRSSVGNGLADGMAYFFMDGAATPFFSTTLDSTGAKRPVSIPVSLLAAGGHVVGVSSTTTPPPSASTLANKSFTVLESNDTGVVVPPTGTEPPMPVAPPMRWVFQAYDFSDVANVNTYVLPTNPARMSRSFGSVEFTNEPTTVSNGKIISWEGAPKPPTWTFEGSVLTKQEFDNMLSWGRTGQRFYVTDHFGHRYLVKCIEYSALRVRDPARPWNHTYKMSVSVLAGTGVLA